MRKARKQPRAKSPTRKAHRSAHPILDVLNSLDAGTVAELRQMMREEMGFGSEFLDPESVVSLFSEYLAICANDDINEDAMDQYLSDLVIELGELKVSANGGDRGAREDIQTILDLLDNAIESRSISPVDMIMLGKVFGDAGLAVPDSLRKAVAEGLHEVPTGLEAATEQSLVETLLEMIGQFGDNPFDMHEHVSSLLASLPPEVGGSVLQKLVAGRKTMVTQAVSGFLLHPDPVLAQSMAATLAISAQQAPVESSLVERLVRMRPWLPRERQVLLDTPIRAMRLNALPPVKTELPKLIKCYASVCDGSGTRNLVATLRSGARYQMATVMMKPAGVVDAMVLPEVPKSVMDDMVRQMKSSVLMVETDLAGFAAILALALADGSASGTLPPFKLIEVVESLGLGPIQPDSATPREILVKLLAGLPPEQTGPAAVANAHAAPLGSEFRGQWFEAGEALENLLYPVKGTRQRIARLMTDYLPLRRAFWARQFAISALVLRGDGKTSHPAWKQLALVGRDIDAGLSLEQIPIMRQVAEKSVQAFEWNQ